MGVAGFHHFLCLLENQSCQLVLNCHMWQVLKAIASTNEFQELECTLDDDWTWVRHYFEVHPDQQPLESPEDDTEWLQIEW